MKSQLIHPKYLSKILVGSMGLDMIIKKKVLGDGLTCYSRDGCANGEWIKV